MWFSAKVAHEWVTNESQYYKLTHYSQWQNFPVEELDNLLDGNTAVRLCVEGFDHIAIAATADYSSYQ